MNDDIDPSTDDARTSWRVRGTVIAVTLMIAAGGTWFGFYKFRAKAAPEAEYIYAAVMKGDIEDLVTSTGTLQPRDYVDVGAQVSGQIEKLYVEIGDVVQVGQVLASIDATSSEARVEANRASLESSQTNLDNQKNNLAKAERDYERQKNLFKEDATTKESLLNAETQLTSARNQIRSSEAQIRQQIANMRIEENNLKYTRIVAPIAGTVMSIAVKQGQTVNATQNVPNVMRIANLGTMTVQSDVSEADVAKLFKGIPVYFTTLGGQDRRWFSQLKRIEPTPKVQNSVVLYNALFDIQNEGTSLMPSMTAQVFFVSAQARNVMMVPLAALQHGQRIARELAAKNKDKPAEKAADRNAKGPATGTPGKTDQTGAPPKPGAATSATAQVGANPSTVAPGGGLPGAAQGISPELIERFRSRMQQGGGGGMQGLNGQAPTPEQMEQFRRMFSQAGGAGGLTAFGGAGMPGGGGSRQPAQRRGTVAVKLPDGKIGTRQIVIGVTNRVYGQVLEGLKEGEEVVVGRREPESSAAAGTGLPNAQGGRSNLPAGLPGGFPSGGLPAGFRPF